MGRQKARLCRRGPYSIHPCPPLLQFSARHGGPFEKARFPAYLVGGGDAQPQNAMFDHENDAVRVGST